MKWVFFDFNGTIIDDVELCLNLLNEILVSQNKNTIDLKKYKNIFCFPIKHYYELAGVDFNINSYEELSKWFIKEYQPQSFNCKLFPNLKETVLKLKDKGIMVGVLSASEKNNLIEQLKKFNIYNLFDVVLGLDNIHAASKIDIAKEFIQSNKINPKEILFVGDTTHDYSVASEIGGKILLFTQGHQSKEVLMKTNATLISDLSEVLEYI